MDHFAPQSSDKVNIVLMLIACALAFIVPLEMVLLSYAFLGPAHYLTQISWMHDRDYFTDQKMVWAYGAILTGLIIMAVYLPQMGGNDTIYSVYILALSAAFATVVTPKAWQRIILPLICLTVFLVIRGVFPEFVLGFILLFPSVIHIYVFTGCFILYGAFKSDNIWGFVSFAVFIACGLVFYFVKPSDIIIAPIFVANNIGIFERTATYLANLLSFRGWVDGHAVLGFLAFAYTYHYLNWFSKVNVIKWNVMDKRRVFIICVLYVLSISIYLYDYRIGVLALLFLSILHVLLELPLNILTIRSIGNSILKIIFVPRTPSF
ncbi:MAG: hypothetical protein OEY94_04580 [Alphaproteobacteria bacterium]|nr:hypothetical protein [Alphaproteobacteria bacterium]